MTFNIELMNNNSDITDELNAKPILGQPYGEDEDDHSIELAPIETSSSTKKKKKKKKSSKTGESTDENESQKKKKKKKSKKTKEGKKSKRIKKGSQSSSIAEFFESISSIDTFAFEEASHDSDQDSCYKSTGALTPTGTGALTPATGTTPVGEPKKKLAAPSSAPLGNERKKKISALRASQLSPKQSDFLSRRERRRANMGADTSLLNNSYHGITPTSRKRMTVKIGKGLDNSNHSLPDLFAFSPASSSGTPTARIRRRISMKSEQNFHNSLPDLFSFSPGALDDGSPIRRRPPRVNSADKMAWTPRAPTLTRRISSRSLCDSLNSCSLHSFASGKSDSSDDPFKSPTTEMAPPVPKMGVPDHHVGESSDEDVGLMYETPFVSPSGRTAKKRVSDGSNVENPFELLSKAFVEHQEENEARGNLSTDGPMSNSGDFGVPSTPGSMPVQELDSDASESSFSSPLPTMLKPKVSDGIPMTSPNSVPVQERDSDTSESSFAADGLQKLITGNLVGENDNTDDDERSLDMDELFGLPPTAADNTKEDPKEASQEYSDSSFGFDSPFAGAKAEKSKRLTSKVIATSSALDGKMNRSFKEALSVDPFDSDESSVEASSPPQALKGGFSGTVLSASSLNEEMNQSFHDALNLDPFEAPEYINNEEFGTERNDDDVVEELNPSFQDTLDIVDFAAEEFKSMEFETKPTRFVGKVKAAASDLNGESEEVKLEVALESWTVPESPTIGDTKKDAVVRGVRRIENPSGIKTQDDDDGSCSSDSSFGSEESNSLPVASKAALGIPKKGNNASLSGFIDKNSDHHKSLAEEAGADDTSKNSRSVSSFEKLKLRVRRSTTSFERLGLSNQRSQHKQRRQPSIDDLIGSKKRSSKSWDRLRSAMSVVSVGSKSSQATKSSTEPEESSLPASNEAFWNNIHSAKSTTAAHRSAGGRLRMDGRVAVGRRARKSEKLSLSDVTETRTSSDGLSIASEKVSKANTSKDKQTKRKKKKKKNSMQGQSDHSTESFASGKEGGDTKKKTKSKSSHKVSKSKKPESDDLFLAFVSERKPNDGNVGDVFSC